MSLITVRVSCAILAAVVVVIAFHVFPVYYVRVSNVPVMNNSAVVNPAITNQDDVPPEDDPPAAFVDMQPLRTGEIQPVEQPSPVPPPADPIMTVPEEERIYTPNSSVLFAIGDLTTVEPGVRKFVRYLSLYNIPKAERPKMAQSISFLINSLSKRKRITIPEFVGASDQTLIRIDLLAYDIEPKAWDELGLKGSGVRPYSEPFFHVLKEPLKAQFKEIKVQKQVQVPTGRTLQNGQPEMKTETREVIEKIPVKVPDLFLDRAPWLDPKLIVTLETELHTLFPLFRADWFLANACQPPAYYNLLGIGNTLADFEKFVFADEKTASKARAQDKGIVIQSTVARNNRTLTRSPTLGSSYNYYWRSHDTKVSTGNRDYAKNPLDESFDATEDIATLPNGLQVYFLSDGAGKRLDEADINIAKDSTAVDGVVRTGRSCMICHSDGIRPIADEVRTLTRMLRDRESVRLLTVDGDKWLRVQDLFSSNLERQIQLDQQHYADVIAEATGIASPAENAALFSRFYDAYAEQLLDKTAVAREVGCTVLELEKYMRGIQINKDKRMGSNDNVILGLIKVPSRPVRRDHFLESYSGFMRLIMDIRKHEGQAEIPGPPVVK